VSRGPSALANILVLARLAVAMGYICTKFGVDYRNCAVLLSYVITKVSRISRGETIGLYLGAGIHYRAAPDRNAFETVSWQRMHIAI